VLLVSIDPRGDTPARVHGFLARASLSGRVSFLSGPRAALAPVWRAYRIPAPSGGAAAVERAATVVLIDAAGRERVQFGVEQLTPEALAHDIARLQGASNGG
jgi:cytochrome oxidase Cu insertion factor (SCO1/SenC/PrrC family)